MKKYVFGFVCEKRTHSKTYGGSNYTLGVYDLTGGNVTRIGGIERSTRSHKGELSEAWGVVLDNHPRLEKIIAKRAPKYATSPAYSLGYYYNWIFEIGVELHNLGGA